MAFCTEVAIEDAQARVLARRFAGAWCPPPPPRMRLLHGPCEVVGPCRLPALCERQIVWNSARQVQLRRHPLAQPKFPSTHGTALEGGALPRGFSFSFIFP